MGFFKRIAFYLGMVLGLVTVAAAGTVALTYLFTGKFPSFEKGTEKTEVRLVTADEVVELIRSQVEKAEAEDEPQEGAGGEDDGEA